MTRVLVVDDSALMRRLLRRLFEAEPGFETAFAADGASALEALHSFQPDVVTLDVNMPGMDGLACLDRIMIERPTPVIMLSSLTLEGAAASVQALALGAVDVLEKPGGPVSIGIDALGPLLLEKVQAAKETRLRRTHRLTERVRTLTGAPAATATQVRPLRRAPVAPLPALAPAGEGLVLVGCSTGGPPALDALLGPLPAKFPWPIVVAQHMPAAFTGPLARRLDSLCAVSVVEVTQPTLLAPGHAYIAHGDADIVIMARSTGLMAQPTPSSGAHVWHPSVDRLVDSALEALPASALAGVLMTGMGSDGAAAMTRLRAQGGWTLAESDATAVVWGMPGELVRAGGASEVAPLDDLARRLAARLAFHSASNR